MSTDGTTLQELNAFIDGELELTRQLDLEARLASDAALRARVDELRSVRDAVRERAEYHAAPDALRARLQAAGAPTPSRAPHFDLRRWFAWRPLALGSVLAALLAWTIGLAPWTGGADEALMQEVIASHSRATLGERLVDVASSDRHTVKPWLSSKLDFSPPVGDVPVPGASFVGGRVDYLDGRPVAVLVYRQRQHVIDAYVWPSAQGDAALRAQSQRGFNLVHWAHGGMRFWLVSDLNRDELGAFARALAQGDPSH